MVMSTYENSAMNKVMTTTDSTKLGSTTHGPFGGGGGMSSTHGSRGGLSAVPTGFDANSIEEKMKKFKFAQRVSSGRDKDADWFRKFRTNTTTDKTETSTGKLGSSIKVGLSESDHRQIHKEMIPQFIAIQEELKPQHEHIKNVGKELKELQKEFGVKMRQVNP